ncbi:sugar ABC transporter substrate-binding protein [Goodfellowiella coeruleoviolacea]|uniref:Simple sugar transport system substrate-binding protein n=1 Tax=Goodfellowiella coeruleoviolacea TaxID=334858 RepID=A0AAE3KEH6_9PSEU|nr:sugar ABC transporter substrate-binding protein [Goodfellowiella coeruleoviolacea]MCP2163912.1 simple sugar transport system substrate-binding protein [Goodfellowiella coeruleoviolacea]
MRTPRDPRRRGALLALLTGVLALAACTGPKAEAPAPAGTAGQQSTRTGPLRIVVVSHGTPGDAFWNVVKNGAEQAGADLDVDVSYQADPDPGNQAKLVDNAVAQGADGVVVSLGSPDALRASVAGAVGAGIPVITINSGAEHSTEFGAIAHVGQTETVAGQAAGQRLAQAGRHRLLCVIHQAGVATLNQRCDGARQGFAGGQVTNLQVDINNPTDSQSRIRGALQSDPGIDAVLTLNPQTAANAVNAVRESGSGAAVATFDLNADVVGAIKAGELLFAVDQQQYEQGYLPVVYLKLYLENANTVGGGQPVLTGPGFVDSSNVDTVGEYARRGTR